MNHHEENWQAGQAHAAVQPFPMTKGEVGMIAFLFTEAAFFSTLIVAYVTYIGKSLSGPTPEDFRMSVTWASTVFLLSSSFTMHTAARALERGNQGRFRSALAVTILLGTLFLGGTALEWRELIVGLGLTIGRNLFGTTYFTLIGFHAAHVTTGVVLMLIALSLAFRGHVVPRRGGGFELLTWYWHFVDAVWVVIFILVYFVSRGA
jgi:cytochrome c oxidase subunit III